MTIEHRGDVITCDDCGVQVTATWALSHLLDAYDRAWTKIRSEQQSVRRVAETQVELKAAQRVEEAWRGRKMVPICPHCREAIFATDGFGASLVNREIAIARRAARAASDRTGDAAGEDGAG